MSSTPRCRRDRRAGFTLPEVMIASSVFLLVIAAIISTNLFGVRMIQATQPKLEAEEDARRLCNRMRDEIQRAKVAHVGTGGLVTFTAPAFGASRQGNALQLHLTADTANYVRYFRDAADNTLKRTVNGGGSEVIIRAVTNTTVFSALNFDGSVLTRDQGKPVIQALLRFSAIGRSAVPVGPGWLFQGNELLLRVAPREN